MKASDWRRGWGLAAIALAVAACSSSGTPTPVPAPTAAQATQAPASAAPSAAPASAAPTAAPSEAPVTLTYLTDDNNVTAARVKAVTAAYTKLHPNVTFQFDIYPQGAEGDNLVKTRLATGEMDDLFNYNSGSLFQALNPTQTLVDLTNEPFIANIIEAYLPTVSAGGKIYGVPNEGSLGGGILYNKKVYSQLGLSIPKTWAEFEANNAKIKAAGIAPVCATFADSWTSQLFVLADFYNVQTAVPDFVTKYTANQANYENTAAAQIGFQHLQEGFKEGWWQKDYAADKFETGQQLLATAKCAHYPMLTFAVGTIAQNFPQQINDIGFFAQPGADASKNGLTVWMPAATYIPTTSKHIDAAKQFLAFAASVDGTKAMSAGVDPSGPYMIKGASMPDTVPGAIKDMQPYIDAGLTSPALEFLSPVKGPNLDKITVAVGSGINTAEQGAKLYDQDIAKQAQQLGLPGW